MNLFTLVAYLRGSEEAILKIAASRRAIWVGLLLVLSAGLAREYDGEDLMNEPWHLLLPLAASLATSAILAAVVFLVAKRRGCREVRFPSFYRSFLSLYWLTAPLAWLYAIPVERLLTPGDATSANLWLLAIVSAWRVALMTRVISVLFRASPGATFGIVMLFANSVMLILLRLTPIPVFALMGGVRLSESEAVLAIVSFMVSGLGLLSWPLWAIWTIGVLLFEEPRWRYEVAERPNEPVTKSAWAVAVASLLFWLPILPFTQQEQQNRYRVEQELKSGRFAAALAYMSARHRGDFPPHWDPPPRLGYEEYEPPLAKVMEVLFSTPNATWVHDLWQKKFSDAVASVTIWHHPGTEVLEGYVTLLEAMPNGPEIMAESRPREWEEIAKVGGVPEELGDRIIQLVAAANQQREEANTGTANSAPP